MKLSTLNVAIIRFIVAVFIISGCSEEPPREYLKINNFPDIYPDYINVTIPPNIAPLNFTIKGANTTHFVSIECKNKTINIKASNLISIPFKEWKELLSNSKGDSLKITVYKKENNRWKQFIPFYWYVSNEKIDCYLSYRLIEPTYANWHKMGIYQRCLENFCEKEIINNELTGGNCMNCHSYCKQNANQMVFHMRKNNGGTYLINNGKITKLNTKTKYTESFFVYPSWHPSGKMIAFTVNNTQQSFYMSNNKRSEVYDVVSNIIIYDIDNNEIFTCPQLSSKDNLEIFPSFAPDGKKLFFCSSKSVKDLPKNANQIVYSLCSIDFNPSTKTFANKVDTLISSSKLGKGVSFAHPSPDGKYILCCILNYGCFPSWSKESDLYLYNLNTRDLKPLNKANSNRSESYSSWSSNSRWIVISSRRLDNGFNRPFFAYVNDQGEVCKPFLLPQKNPESYIYSMKSYNIPEFTKNEVTISPYEIQKCAKSPVSLQVKYINNKENQNEKMPLKEKY